MRSTQVGQGNLVFQVDREKLQAAREEREREKRKKEAEEFVKKLNNTLAEKPDGGPKEKR